MRKVLVEKYEKSFLKGGATIFLDKNGDFPRFHDLPAVESSFIAMWVKHGKKHRKHDAPAVVQKANGIILESQFWFDGNLHREGDKPAIIRRPPDIQTKALIGAGQFTESEIDFSEMKDREGDILMYYKNGLLHRKEDPAKIYGKYHFYYENGILKEKKMFYLNKFVDYVFYNPIIFAFLISLTIITLSVIMSFISSLT